MTLRGSWSQEPCKVGDFHRILSYESPDRTKAWALKGAWVWPKEAIGDWGVSAQDRDNAFQYWSALWTDTSDNQNIQAPLDCSESRQIAWLENGYELTAEVTSCMGDFLSNWRRGGFLDDSEMLIDLDRIITNDLFVTVQYTKEFGDNTPTIEWNYFVVLEEINISPTEGILQQLKGIGQSINS